FSQLDLRGEDEEVLANRVARGGNGVLTQWFYYVELLGRRGMLCRCIHVNGTRLISLVAIASSFVPRPMLAVVGQPYLLSRFTYLRREKDTAVLESPLAHARIILNDCRMAAIISALAKPCTVERLVSLVGDVSLEAIIGVSTLLLRAGMLGETDPDGNCVV